MTTNESTMRTTRMSVTVLVLLASAAGAAGPPAGPLTKCPPDSVVAGTTCMDKYEASAWRVPNPTTTNAGLVKKIQQGKATAEALAAAGATQVGLVSAPNDWRCSETGQAGCGDIYAVSIVGVMPSTLATWFMAQEACANSRKRLPTSAEWQVAANGTPDPNRFTHPTTPVDNGTTDCNVLSGPYLVPTGSRSGCVSARGAFDMIGNVWEWVADWVTYATSCPGWGTFSDDYLCMSPSQFAANTPGGVVRGGARSTGTAAGPLATRGDMYVGWIGDDTGFRCAR